MHRAAQTSVESLSEYFHDSYPPPPPAHRAFRPPAVFAANVLERKRRDKPSLRLSRQWTLRTYRTYNPEGLNGFDRLSDRSEHFSYSTG